MLNVAALSAINFNHLFYFWVVAREGSITGASRTLGLTHPTVSGQVHALERALGQQLIARRGRTIELTEAGEVARDYADSIMSLGADMVDVLTARPRGGPLRLVVGVSNALPKLIARSLLEPALRLEQPVRLVCRDDQPARLFAALAANEVDMVLTDVPLPPKSTVRAFNHVLGESDVSFFASPELARRLEPGFRARWTARRCCCRPTTPAYGRRSTRGSWQRTCARASSPRSRTPRSSRCSDGGGSAHSPQRPSSSLRCTRSTR